MHLEKNVPSFGCARARSGGPFSFHFGLFGLGLAQQN